MIKFKELWDSYPTIQGEKAPCKTDGKKNFEDQCAIRLGVSLAQNGVKTTNLVSKQRHCWHHKNSDGHILAAEELANGLAKHPIPGIQKATNIDSKKFQKDLSGKN